MDIEKFWVSAPAEMELWINSIPGHDDQEEMHQIDDHQWNPFFLFLDNLRGLAITPRPCTDPPPPLGTPKGRLLISTPLMRLFQSEKPRTLTSPFVS